LLLLVPAKLAVYADAAILKPGQKAFKAVIAEMGGKNA